MAKVQIIRKLNTARMAASEQTLIQKNDAYFVVSSANNRATGFVLETMVFPADETGHVTDWIEVAGGKGMSQADAIGEFEKQ